MKTLIILIDFYGHPILATDPFTNNLRYSFLSEIINEHWNIDLNRCAIFSKHPDKRDGKLSELHRMATKKGFKWALPPVRDMMAEYDIPFLKQYLKGSIGFDLNQSDTQIVIGGTNTSGCVFRNSTLGAYHWVKSGYKTKIYLPMCAEYEHNGVNDFHKNIAAFTILYNKIKQYNCFEVDIVKKIQDIDMDRKGLVPS